MDPEVKCMGNPRGTKDGISEIKCMGNPRGTKDGISEIKCVGNPRGTKDGISEYVFMTILECDFYRLDSQFLWYLQNKFFKRFCMGESTFSMGADRAIKNE